MAEQKPLSLAPDLPRSDVIVKEGGQLTDEWKLFFEQQTQGLQSNLKPEGFALPQVDEASIALLTAQNSQANVLYDSDTNLFQGNMINSALPQPYVWATFAMIVFRPAPPSGNTAGIKGWLCFSASPAGLYMCTQTGDAASTIWVAV